MSKFSHVQWHKGDIVRNIKTNKPVMVINVFTHTCTIVVDLEDNSELVTPKVILQRNYADWELDEKFETEEKEDSCIMYYAPARMSL